MPKNNEELFKSYSSTDFKVIKLQHTWTINNFSLSSEQTGRSLLSPKFSAGTNDQISEWYLTLYPKGESKKSNQYVSLYLNLTKCKGKGLHAAYKFSVMDSSDYCIKSFNDTRRFMVLGNGWGTSQLIEQDFLYDELNDCLSDDKLTIVCEITVKIGGSTNISGT